MPFRGPVGTAAAQCRLARGALVALFVSKQDPGAASASRKHQLSRAALGCYQAVHIASAAAKRARLPEAGGGGGAIPAACCLPTKAAPLHWGATWRFTAFVAGLLSPRKSSCEQMPQGVPTVPGGLSLLLGKSFFSTTSEPAGRGAEGVGVSIATGSSSTRAWEGQGLQADPGALAGWHFVRVKGLGSEQKDGPLAPWLLCSGLAGLGDAPGARVALSNVLPGQGNGRGQRRVSTAIRRATGHISGALPSRDQLGAVSGGRGCPWALPEAQGVGLGGQSKLGGLSWVGRVSPPPAAPLFSLPFHRAGLWGSFPRARLPTRAQGRGPLSFSFGCSSRIGALC